MGNFEAYMEAVTPVFIFCIYLPDGRYASQWLKPSEEVGTRCIKGKGIIVRFKVSELYLGEAAYLASTAIYKKLGQDGLESESPWHDFKPTPAAGIKKAACFDTFPHVSASCPANPWGFRT